MSGTFKRILKQPSFLIVKLNDHGLLKWLPDHLYLPIAYKTLTGHSLDLKNPKTFNEKLQWLKINDRKDIYTKIVDKYEFKQYISDLVGSEYVVKNLGVYDSFDQIDFDALPNQFVLKCTHDSGGLVICKDKSLLDFNKAKAKIEECLKKEYYYHGREWQYKNVKPRIICEEYLEGGDSGIADYKIHCFNGEPKVTLVCTNRFGDGGICEDFYDNDWNHLDIQRKGLPNNKELMDRPELFDEMLEISRKICQDFKFIRVDFYCINHHLYIGELTFSPTSGFKGFVPEKIDDEWGEWLKLD